MYVACAILLHDGEADGDGNINLESLEWTTCRSTDRIL